MMTWPPFGGDYCSMIIGVLQISSTTRNLVPRFKRWSKGTVLVTNLVSLLGLAWLSRKGWSFLLMSSFLCFRSSWWSRHPFFKNSIVVTKRIRDSSTTIECYKGKSSGGYPKNEHRSISRVEQMKHIESKVSRYHEKLRASRQSFDAWNRAWKGFRVAGISIVSDTRIDHL